MWTGNVGLLNVVRQRILDNAARFNMYYFGTTTEIPDGMVGLLEVPACHTQACIAGETLLETGAAQIDRVYGGILWNGLYPPREAARVLGLTREESDRLFMFRSWDESDRGWPVQFEVEYNEAKTPAARAEVASRRILHFIATEGRE